MMNLKWKVGDTTITKITEIIYPEFSDLIPAATPEVVKKVQWLFPHFVTPEGQIIPFDTYNSFYRPGAPGAAKLRAMGGVGA